MPAAVVAVGASIAGSAAATAVGLTAGTLAFTAVSSVVAFGVQTLGSKLLGGGDSGSSQIDNVARGILGNASSPVAPIPVIYGARRIGGNRVFLDVTGEGRAFLHQVFVWCEGEVAGVGPMYLDDRPTNDAYFAAGDGGAGAFKAAQHTLGTDGQSALSLAVALFLPLFPASARAGSQGMR